MDHTVHLEYPQLCIYIWIIIWTMCMYIYIVELDTDHRNLVELLPVFCFDVSVGWPSVPSCSTLGPFMYEKKHNKISPCSISMVFYIYIFIFGIHIPMWYFSQSAMVHGHGLWSSHIPRWESSDTMDTAWWYTYPSDTWWSDSQLGWFISN